MRLQQFEQILAGTNWVVAYRWMPFSRDSVFFQVMNQLNLLGVQVDVFQAQDQDLQAKIFYKVVAEMYAPPTSLLLPRLRYWNSQASMNQADRIRLQLNILASNPPDACTIAALEALVNAWPTSRRYRQGAQVCRFGCHAVGGDSVEHYVSCPIVRPVLTRCLPFIPAEWGDGDHLSALFFAGLPCPSKSRICSIAIAFDLLFSAFNSLRTRHIVSSEVGVRALESRLRALCTSSRVVRLLAQGRDPFQQSDQAA
eukprot:449469-Pyramimonas_sp.AAC.1